MSALSEFWHLTKSGGRPMAARISRWRQIAKRILQFLKERVAAQSDPRKLGQALKGSELGEFWKYRVGSYRIIAAILDYRICILVLRIGNRKEAYK